MEKLDMAIWIVLAVVVFGFLFVTFFFMACCPVGGVVCNSSDPTKIVMQTYNISTQGEIGVNIQNYTGGPITINHLSGNGSMANVSADVPLGSILEDKNRMKLFVDCGGSPCVNGYQYTGNTDMNYTDQFGYHKSVKLACVGTLR